MKIEVKFGGILLCIGGIFEPFSTAFGLLSIVAVAIVNSNNKVINRMAICICFSIENRNC